MLHRLGFLRDNFSRIQRYSLEYLEIIMNYNLCNQIILSSPANIKKLLILELQQKIYNWSNFSKSHKFNKQPNSFYNR